MDRVWVRRDWAIRIPIHKFSVRRRQPKLWKLALLLVLAIFLSLAVLWRTLPSVAGLETLQAVSSKIYDRNGKLLYEIYGEARRSPVPLNKVSLFLQKATVAAEDKNFYQHGALSFPAMLRAAWKDYQARAIVQGGSTISQQVVKNIFLSSDRSFTRKIQEAVLALRLESSMNKDQILETYLNTVPYGRNAYGAQAAAQNYFGKSAADLDLAESAYLAAMPQAPSFYSPSGDNFKYLKQRQQYILRTMESLGYISYSESSGAQTEKVSFKSPSNPITAPYFVKWIQQSLESQYGIKVLQQQGLEIYTSLDADLQAKAEAVVEKYVDKNGKRYNAHNAGLVAMDPNNGQILAMVGGAGYFAQSYPPGCTPGKNCQFDPQVNVAVANRQPGSSFKPYTYVTAFSPGFNFSPASPILDQAQNFAAPGAKPYVPRNFDGQNHGLLPMRKALAGSLNIAAVRTLSMIGVDSVVNTVKSLGISTPMENCGLSLTLGACEVKLVEHTAGFAAFANGGKKVTPNPILKIVDKTGRVLADNQSQSAVQQVLNSEAVYELDDVLSDNKARSFIFGSSSPLTLKDRPVAAKTGTSQDFKDAWTLGFTPQLVVGVWAGNNDGTLMKRGADGVVVAAPMWHEFMQTALKDKPVLAFQMPPGIQQLTVSATNGKLATAVTPNPVKEIFADYSAPTQFDPYVPTTTDESLVILPPPDSTDPNFFYPNPVPITDNSNPSKLAKAPLSIILNPSPQPLP